MISINLYQPGKLDITVDFPAAWNELRPEEVIFVAKTLLEQTEANANETRPALLKYFLENSARAEKKDLPEDWFLHLDIEQVFLEVLPQLDFIFTTNDLTNLPGRKLIGNEEFFPVSFENMTCGEYEDCEVIANQYADEESIELLANLAAILFRPKRWRIVFRDGMIRGWICREIVPYMKYNHRTDAYYTYKSEQKAKHFLKLPPKQLYAIFIWYAGCRNQLPLKFPDVYDGPSGEPDMLAFTKCIHSGAGPKNGSREKIRVTRLYEYMFEMNEESRKAKELEAQYAQINNT